MLHKQINDLETEYWDVIDALNTPVKKAVRRGSAATAKKSVNAARASNAFASVIQPSSYPSSGYTEHKMGIQREEVSAGYGVTPVTVSSSTTKIMSKTDAAKLQQQKQNQSSIRKFSVQG